MHEKNPKKKSYKSIMKSLTKPKKSKETKQKKEKTLVNAKFKKIDKI